MKRKTDSIGVAINMTQDDISDANSSSTAELVAPVRLGWEAQFELMAARGDDKLLDEETIDAWDEREWR